MVEPGNFMVDLEAEWGWPDLEVPKERHLQLPLICQTFGACHKRILEEAAREVVKDLASGLRQPPQELLKDLDLARERALEPILDEDALEEVVKTLSKMDLGSEESLAEEAMFTPPPSGGRAQLPYCHGKDGSPAFMGKVLSLYSDFPMPEVPQDEADGTVQATPRSPPVLGRRFTARQIEIGVPTLKRDLRERDAGSSRSCGSRARPWPDEAPLCPGRKSESSTFGDMEVPSVFSFLRSHFADVDVENSRQITEQDLVAFVRARTKKQPGGVPSDYDKLLQESARRCYQQAAVRKGGIRVEDWVHFGLLLASSPSALAHQLLNRRLRQELVRHPQFLKKVLEAFEEADVQGAALLRSEDIQAAFSSNDELLKEVEKNSCHELNYYDFVAFCLGYRRSPVRLNWYDVSHGFAQWLPSGILESGKKLEGIWHTGIVAFGREYWYGGKILASEPGKAPFPPGPLRCTELGTTLRTKEELEDWLRFELVPRYTRDKYDILRRNCNHFSDEVAGFLVQGSHIPDEARRQPEALMGTWLMKAVRPYLNRWLSGFDAEGSSGSEIDDLTAEWRARLWPGDLCLYMPASDAGGQQAGQQAKLVQVSNVDAWRGTCDIHYFEAEGLEACYNRLRGDLRVMRLGSCVHTGSFWDWRLVCQQAVPLLSLRPHESQGSALPLSSRQGAIAGPMGLGALLRAGMRMDPEIRKILQRKAVVYAHCSQGHVMASRDGKWSTAWGPTHPDTCSMCYKTLSATEPALECSSCRFLICGPCDRKGLFRGYYSMGSVDASAARLLVHEPSWMHYKARRYMAMAVAPGGRLGLDMWQGRMSVRLYGDLGQDLPSEGELVELFRRHSATADSSCSLGLDEDQFSGLLGELLAEHANVFHL
eukprot:TRINITY_DN7331_c0_g1_i2.p1 TRINITY_DN7331_c0_g1~~TRINITY_DN7331_c0_g1_i2.p1  ORF type:complete len:880 (-),score=145.83 TRINITY_DN7331_c0_g1_i2:316-2955(-)